MRGGGQATRAALALPHIRLPFHGVHPPLPFRAIVVRPSDLTPHLEQQLREGGKRSSNSLGTWGASLIFSVRLCSAWDVSLGNANAQSRARQPGLREGRTGNELSVIAWTKAFAWASSVLCPAKANDIPGITQVLAGALP